jgi:hypothetical protein
MRKHVYKLICVVLAFASGTTLTHVRRVLFARETPTAAISAASNVVPAERSQPTLPTVEPERPADFLVKTPWTYNGYTIENYSRKALDYPDGPKPPPESVDVSCVVVKKGGKVLGRFDAGIYFPLGNAANFGLFPFLAGNNSFQLFISQDVPRGGCQWIVGLSPHFRIIFDGHEYAVGREGSDMEAIDLDGDGVYELIVPMTAFYGFSEWIPTGQTPLPTIVFKYDDKATRYLPANPLFQDYLLNNIDERKKRASSTVDPINQLAEILPIVLDYIFAGKEQEAWTFYEQSYKLADKKEMRTKIKAVIRDQPVYRFIYKHTASH